MMLCFLKKYLLIIEVIAKLASRAKFSDFFVGLIFRKVTYPIGHRHFAKNRIQRKKRKFGAEWSFAITSIVGFLFCSRAIAFEVNPAKPVVIYTAALIETKAKLREKEYRESLHQLLNAGAQIAIVEACKTSSFFDTYGLPTFYPNVNDLSLKNKGVNEARLLQESLRHFQFDADQMLIKLTGRYLFLSNYFLSFVTGHLDADFIIKKASILTSPNGRPFVDCFTGCYAAKAGALKQFLDQLDFEAMEKKALCIEHELGLFLRENPHLHVIFVDQLDLRANIFYEGRSPVRYSYW